MYKTLVLIRVSILRIIYKESNAKVGQQLNKIESKAADHETGLEGFA